MRNIAAATTIITSRKAMHCDTSQTGFKVFLSLDGPEMPSLLKIFGDLVSDYGVE